MIETNDEIIKVLEERLTAQEQIYQQARTRAEQIRVAIECLRGNHPVVTLKDRPVERTLPRIPLAEIVRRAIEQIPDGATFDYESVAAKGHTLFPMANESDIKRATYSAISGLMKVGKVTRAPGGFKKVLPKPVEI